MSGTNSNPGWTQGVTPTAAQWNALWTGKVDATNGYATGLQLTSPTALVSFNLPQWNTLGRPGAPVNGTLGYNTTLNAVEVFTAGAWQQIANILNPSLTNPTISGGTIAGSLAITMAGPLALNTAAAVTAAGSTQGTATALTAQMNIVTDCPASAGVIVPATLNAATRVVNRGANPCLIYPPTGAQFEAYGTNAPVSLAQDAALSALMVTSTQGYVF